MKSFIFTAVLGSFLGACLALVSAPSYAGQPIYVDVPPAFVVNYGNSGRLKYIRTDVSLRVNGNEAASAVTTHRPHIRNSLVFLLSNQDEKTVNSSKGREALRKVALDEVRTLMQELEGAAFVEDLYFKNFVVQN